MSQSAFSSKARELKFWENVHFPQLIKCQVSGVKWNMSCITCHVSHVMCHMSHFFWDKVRKLIAKGSVINRAYPVYFCFCKTCSLKGEAHLPGQAERVNRLSYKQEVKPPHRDALTEA